MTRAPQSRRSKPTEPDGPSTADTLYLGIDEAGYGPNIGPLVVSLVAFRGPAALCELNWWKVLSGALNREGSPRRLALNDSKQVLAKANGRDLLNQTVHAFLAMLGCPSTELTDLIERFAPEDLASLRQEHWFSPVGDGLSSPPQGCPRLPKTLHQRCMQFCGLSARVVFPGEFNSRIERCDNKAELEIEVVRDLLTRHLRQPGGERNVVITVDRLGGRRYYRPMLEDVAGDAFLHTIDEGPRKSSYRYRDGDREVDIHFCVNGDSDHLPIALASMFAKYLRERVMASLNGFWATHVPGLRPTAGYPGDASRFLLDVQPHLERLSVPMNAFWRCR